MAGTSAFAGYLERLGIEWWYAAHLAYGAIQLVFIPILIPTFVLEVTGSATLAGTAMAVIGLGGLAAPVIGGMADNLRAHRIAQLAGLLAYALGGLLFAFLGQTIFGILAGAICMGIGSATLLMINPAFIVSAGFERDEEATRLTRLNQVMIFGSLVAGIGLSLLTSVGLSFADRFLVLSAICMAAFFLTMATNSKAAARIKVVATDTASREPGTSIFDLLRSHFGILLLAVFFVTAGHGVITGQFPNYMDKVFSVPASNSALALSVSAVVSLLILDAVGRWMGMAGPEPIWLAAVAMKIAMMVGLALLAMVVGGSISILIPLAIYIVYLQGISWADMVQPALAARASSAGAGLTQGLLMFAIASAYAVGNFVGGVSADAFGFDSLTWVVAIVSAVSLVLGYLAFQLNSQKS
ncbi:MAG: MFS transporter [Hyphomicrobiaceae bacterium]